MTERSTDRVLVVGAGLAGCTAAALLKDRYRVTVYECHRVGGLCRDDGGVQECGPHAFHTDDSGVMAFLKKFAVWHDFDLHVQTLASWPELQRLPRHQTDDPAFRVYSEKAWGRPWDELPDQVRSRVPAICMDGRPGYHAGRYRCQPEGGYTALCRAMLDGCDIVEAGPNAWRADLPVCRRLVYCGDINDYDLGAHLPWIGREWLHMDGRLPDGCQVVNYGTHAVPQLRSYSSARLNPWMGAGDNIISTEWPGATPCYPAPGFEAAARRIVAEARTCGHLLCGRMATYRYLDMDATVADVMATIKEAGL